MASSLIHNVILARPGLLWSVFSKMSLYFVVDDSVGDNNHQATRCCHQDAVTYQLPIRGCAVMVDASGLA